jgi:hypothetical protein
MAGAFGATGGQIERESSHLGFDAQIFKLSPPEALCAEIV